MIIIPKFSRAIVLIPIQGLHGLFFTLFLYVKYNLSIPSNPSLRKMIKNLRDLNCVSDLHKTLITNS